MFLSASLDVTMYRDDLAQHPTRTPRPHEHAGRVLMAALSCSSMTCCSRAARCAQRSTRSATTAVRRPCACAALIDRGHRELPIRADYIGKNLPSWRARADLGEAR